MANLLFFEDHDAVTSPGVVALDPRLQRRQAVPRLLTQQPWMQIVSIFLRAA